MEKPFKELRMKLRNYTMKLRNQIKLLLKYQIFFSGKEKAYGERRFMIKM